MNEGEIWKYIAGVEAGVIVTCVGWWIKTERPRIAKEFKENNEKFIEVVLKNTKALNKVSAYLKDVYDRLGQLQGKEEDLKSHTELDFNASDHMSKEK